MVEVEWFGHSCFMIRGKGKTIIFDPFKGIGLPEPDVNADIILCSHGHGDHNNVKPVSHDKSIVIEAFAGTRRIDDVLIKGIAVFHDDSEGSKRGRNSIYRVHIDDLAFCHLGDLGHRLSLSQANEIGAPDVIFLPVGGFFTIGPHDARAVMESLKPKITIPMHYRAPGVSPTFKALKKVDDFVQTDDKVRRLDGPTFTVSRVDLPGDPVIIVPKLR